MSCNLEAFREEFPNVSNTTDIRNLSNKQTIIDWVTIANRTSTTLGFNKALYKLEKTSDGDFIIPQEDNLQDFQKFIEEGVLPGEIIDNRLLNNTISESNLESQMKSDGIISPGFSLNIGLNEEMFSNIDMSQGKDISGTNLGDNFNLDFDQDTDEVLNFKEWVELRQYHLSQLKRQKKRMLAHRANKNQIENISENIYLIEEELKNIDATDPYIIHSSIIEEINNLNTVIDKALDPMTDADMTAKLIENNFVVERIKDLSYTLNTNYFEETKEGLTYFDLNRGLDKQRLDEIIAARTTLVDKYNSSINTLVEKMILNNDFVLQIKDRVSQEKDGKEKIKQFEEKVRILLDPNTKEIASKLDGDYIGGLTLGARSYNNILAETISIMRDINHANEVGQNNVVRKTLQNAYTKLKDVKIGGSYLIDQMWVTDDFGQRTNKLIGPFNNLFYRDLNIIRNLKVAFNGEMHNTPGQIEAYEKWMNTMAEKSDVIIPWLIPSLNDIYKNEPKYAEHFKDFNEQEALEYEQELISKLGKTAYEIEKVRLKKQLDNFLLDGFVTASDEYHKNPLNFIKHFYSDNYTETSDKGGFFVPEFITVYPRGEDRINNNFKNLEKIGKQDFSNFYLSASQMLDYARDVFISLGEFIDVNDVINLEEKAGRAALEDKNLFGKSWVVIKAMWDSFKAPYYDGKREKEGNKNTSINTGYANYGSNAFTEHKEIYKNYSLDKIKEALAKENLTFPESYQKQLDKIKNKTFKVTKRTLATEENINKFEDKKQKDINRLETYFKEKSIEALARKKVNATSSLDIFKRISYATSLAENAATRESTISTINLMKEYISQNEQKTDLSNISKFIEDYSSQNIYKHGYYLRDRWHKLEDTKLFGKINNRKFFKYYTSVEEDLRRLYLSEIKNIKNGEQNIFNFTYDNYKYETHDNSDFENPDGKYTVRKLNDDGSIDESVPPRTIHLDRGINPEEDGIADKYEQYIADKLNKLGKDATVGTTLGGFAWNMFKYYLWIQPISGFKNRIQGVYQNDQAAASGLHGFNTDQLYTARALLNGYGINKMTSYANMSLASRKRRQQWEVLTHLAENLGLLNNVMETMRGGEGGINVYGGFLENAGEFMSDFSMNIPEYKNQMELLVAMLQNYTIKDKNGVEHPMFDPKTMSLPFDPATMKLREEFRTEENIANWENFEADANGNSPQNTLIQHYKSTRNKLHGNYETDDKIAISTTMVGRSATSFMKWSYENFNNQYGTKKVSLLTAEVGVKGRKIPLIERTPLIITHLALNNIGLFTAGTAIAGAVSGAPLFAGATVLGLTFFAASSIGMVGYHIYKNKLSLNMAKSDLNLSMGYFGEVILRTLKTTAVSSSNNAKFVRDNIFSEETLKNWVNASEKTYKDRNLSFKDRQLVSESAQELANKMTTYIQFGLSTLALKYLAILVYGLSDDEDNEEALAKLEELEKKFKFIMNIRNTLTDDVEKWTSLQALVDTFGTHILYRHMSQSYKNLQQAFDDEKYTDEERVVKGAKGSFGFTGLPKIMIDAAETVYNLANGLEAKTSIFENDRVYAGTNEFDDFVLGGHNPEKMQEKSIQKKRAKLRKELESYFNKDYNKKGLDPLKKKEKVKEKVDKVIKKYRLSGKKIDKEELSKPAIWYDVLDEVKESGQFDF